MRKPLILPRPRLNEYQIVVTNYGLENSALIVEYRDIESHVVTYAVLITEMPTEMRV